LGVLAPDSVPDSDVLGEYPTPTQRLTSLTGEIVRRAKARDFGGCNSAPSSLRPIPARRDLRQSAECLRFPTL